MQVKIRIPILQEFLEFNTTPFLFYATYKGIKKAMDLWVRSDKKEAFEAFCKKYDIFYRSDIKFVRAQDYSVYQTVVGHENLTTTKTFGAPIDSPYPGSIHYFISANKEYADNLYAYGWYPIVADERVIAKNFHDVSEFGSHLGYPDCCIQYFFEKNDWRKYCFPYEIFKASLHFDYHCNCFWKDEGSSYIYHMPHTFDCSETIAMVKKIEEEIKKESPETYEEMKQIQQLPILCIREQKYYAFEGKVKSLQELEYTNTYLLGKPEEGDLRPFFAQGNRVVITPRSVDIYHDATLIFSYDTVKTAEIEKPFFIQFQAEI